MDLSTNYLGLKLAHPLISGACPLVDDLDMVRRLEASGAAAIVMRSLFEEQITLEAEATQTQRDQHSNSFAEAQSFLPNADGLPLGPRGWLDQLARVKAAVKVPVIASLNGTTAGGWVRYAKQIEEVGADALELNVYLLSTRSQVEGRHIEDRVVEVAEAVRTSVQIPLAVKLSPFYSSLPNLVRRLDSVGVTAVVLFNRFLQPDIDIEQLDVVPKLQLSDSTELLLRLRWLAILHGRTNMELSASGGVHTVADAIKAVMVGADTVQVVSALLQRGPEHIGVLVNGLDAWMHEHEYTSIRQMRGSMSLQRCPDPEAFERANYAKVLSTWRPAG